MLQSRINANAFGSTFAVFPTAQSQAKNCKRATNPTHNYRHEMIENKHDRKEGRSANSTYPKGGVSCSADSFVVAESLVLRMKFSGINPALRVAANR